MRQFFIIISLSLSAWTWQIESRIVPQRVKQNQNCQLQILVHHLPEEKITIEVSNVNLYSPLYLSASQESGQSIDDAKRTSLWLLKINLDTQTAGVVQLAPVNLIIISNSETLFNEQVNPGSLTVYKDYGALPWLAVLLLIGALVLYYAVRRVQHQAKKLRKRERALALEKFKSQVRLKMKEQQSLRFSSDKRPWVVFLLETLDGYCAETSKIRSDAAAQSLMKEMAPVSNALRFAAEVDGKTVLKVIERIEALFGAGNQEDE